MMAAGEAAYELENPADAETIAETMGFAAVNELGDWLLSLSPGQRQAMTFCLFGVW